MTRSYFPGLDLAEHYHGVMVLSLVTDARNLLDYDTGILVKGRIWDAWAASASQQELTDPESRWHPVANFSQSGEAWECPASLELFDGTCTLTLQENIGIRVHGGASRNYSQKSLSLFFRGRYGVDRLSYPLLPAAVDQNGEAITVYKSFLLRNGGNDREYLKFKDAMLQELLSERRFAHQAARPAILFLNGEYWGICTMCEKYGSTYLETHYPGIDRDNVVLIKDGKLDEGRPGDLALYEELMGFAEEDLTFPAVWRNFKSLMDVESMAEYFAAEIYMGNANWEGQHNIRLWRTRVPQNANEYDDGRWRFLLYDTEYSSGLYGQQATSAPYDSFSAALSAHPLFAAAIQNPEFQSLFYDAIQSIGREDLSPARVDAALEEYSAQWQPFMAEYYLRFGDTGWAWNSNIDRIHTFFSERYDAILAHIDTALPTLSAAG
ncbi:MAG: CotH kinase family protein [Oscillospiraceae bacterium]|nr:CotH kinase family protein [Oscillospiraceae bacterium]